MKKWLIAFVASSALSSVVMADIAADFAANGSTYTTAKSAKANQVSADEAVKQLIAAGADPVSSVQSVARVYGGCDNSYAAVRAGAVSAPDRAADIVGAISGAQACGCSGATPWPRSRLERRIRSEAARTVFNLDKICGCTAMSVEAAIEGAPDRNKEIVDAALRAGERTRTVVDSIGQIGVSPGAAWGDSLTTKSPLRRQARICQGDINTRDQFDPAVEWEQGAALSDLGAHSVNCSDSEGSEDEQRTRDLIISEYISSDGNNRVLELYNGTNSDVDLASGNYQVEVFFDGADLPGQIIRLTGTVKAGSSMVIANSAAADVAREKVNDTVPGLGFSAPDAVVLKRDFATPDCGCAATALAASINVYDGADQNSFRESLMSRYSASGSAGPACSAAVADLPMDPPYLFVDGAILDPVEDPAGGESASPN
jgi:hypothetical protein